MLHLELATYFYHNTMVVQRSFVFNTCVLFFTQLRITGKYKRFSRCYKYTHPDVPKYRISTTTGTLYLPFPFHSCFNFLAKYTFTLYLAYGIVYRM